jgi:hypothetical protein
LSRAADGPTRRPAQVLSDHRVLVFALEHLQRALPDESSPLLGMTAGEIEARLRQVRVELDLQANLILISAFESEVFHAFDHVVSRKLRRTIRAHLKPRTLQPPFDDLLRAWRTAGGIRSPAIGEFRQVLGLRHWLAHGRRWELDPSGFQFASPHLVHARGAALLEALGIDDGSRHHGQDRAK